MRYWKEEEVIKIRSTREEEVLKDVEEEDEDEDAGGEEGKGTGRRHAKLVRQSRVKESMSPRSIRCLHIIWCYRAFLQENKPSRPSPYFTFKERRI